MRIGFEAEERPRQPWLERGDVLRDVSRDRVAQRRTQIEGVGTLAELAVGL